MVFVLSLHSKKPAASITEAYICLPCWNALVLHPTDHKACKVESCGGDITQTCQVLCPEHKLPMMCCFVLLRTGSDGHTAGFVSETLCAKDSASLNPEVIDIWCQWVEGGGGCSSAAHPRVVA